MNTGKGRGPRTGLDEHWRVRQKQSRNADQRLSADYLTAIPGHVTTTKTKRIELVQQQQQGVMDVVKCTAKIEINGLSLTLNWQ
jgi:hypothetical protein